MFVAELRIYPHHLLLALLAIPVLWGARHWYQSWKISNANRRYVKLCREGHEIQRLESRNRERRAKGLQTVPGPSGPKHRALAANFKL